MAALLHGEPSRHGVNEAGAHKVAQDNLDKSGGCWYFSRRETEENSPSRRNGIDLKKETYLRKSYCTFLQDLGMRLKVPQVTIATAIIFCHRFFLRQSHAKNDRRTIATVCMFLAGKVEETPRPLKDVILVSYEIVHKKDHAAIQRIKQKEVFEQQKELILLAERVVLSTLGFDLNVLHPYKPLVEAIKKFKVAQNALAQVAWNFVNDGLRTSLCLQFQPHHIAAGAIFLAAKFLKVKLPSDGEKVWWQEFDVTPRQLEEVSNQMLELYEQNRAPPSQASEAEGSAGGSQRPSMKAPASHEEHASSNSNPQVAGALTAESVKPGSSKLNPNQSYGGHIVPQQSNQSRHCEYGSSDACPNSDHNGDVIDDHREREMLTYQENVGETQNKSRSNTGARVEENHEGTGGKIDKRDAGELKDKYHCRTSGRKDITHGESPQDAIKKFDKDKLKAAIEKRRKYRGDTSRKPNFMDDDDLIERELEDGIELVAESEKTKQERRQRSYNNRLEHDNAPHNVGGKEQVSHGETSDIVEEGEVEPFGRSDKGHPSPKLINRKRRASSPSEKSVEGKLQRHDCVTASHMYNNSTHHDLRQDKNSRLGRHGYSERDHEGHLQENHI